MAGGMLACTLQMGERAVVMAGKAMIVDVGLRGRVVETGLRSAWFVWWILDSWRMRRCFGLGAVRVCGSLIS